MKLSKTSEGKTLWEKWSDGKTKEEQKQHGCMIWSVKTAWYCNGRNNYQGVALFVAHLLVGLRVLECGSVSPLKAVRLYCGAAEAQPVAQSSTETQTPAAFTVTDLCLPLMSALPASPLTTETLPLHQLCPVKIINKYINKKITTETTHSY